MRTSYLTAPVRIPIRVPTHQFTSNFNEVLITKTKSIYEGVCYRGYKIIRIVEIAKDHDGRPIYTTPKFDNMRRDNTSVCDVMVRMEVLKFNKYDIIPNCEVINIDKRHIMCKWQHGTAIIKFNTILQSIKVGQIIPVRVGEVSYPLNEQMIVVKALPLIPIKPTNPILCAIDKPSNQDMLYIKNLYQKGVDFEKKVDCPMYRRFADMLTISSWNGEAPVGKEVSIATLLEDSKEVICTRGYVKHNGVLLMDAASDVLSVKWVAMMAVILDDWITFMSTCHVLANTYKDDNSKNIWKIYDDIKQKLCNSTNPPETVDSAKTTQQLK